MFRVVSGFQNALILYTEDAVLRDHAATCVESAIASGSAEEQRHKFDELVELIGKVKR